MDIINQLNWRYATKEFDRNKKLSSQQVSRLLQAINLSASSFGLQPYQILLIESVDIRKILKQAAWEQKQVTDASHLLIFAAQTNLSESHVDEFLERVANTRHINKAQLKEYETLMKGSLTKKNQQALTEWAARQCYIALGQLLVTCAIEEIDACPMEGFDKVKFDEILGLKEKSLTSIVMATVGYRALTDKYQHLTKVRKTINQLVIKF